MGRERREEGHVAVGPFARLARHRRQRPDHAVVMHERRDEVARELEDAVVFARAVAPIGARVRPGCGPTGPQHLADPALTDAERRQGGGQVVGQASPRRDVQLVVAEDPDRDVVDAESPFRLVHDRAEQVLSFV